MKKINNISFVLMLLSAALTMSSCGKDKRLPGTVYVPDMAYSRTIETYDKMDSLKFTSDIYNKGGNKIFFNEMPVPGTIKRGELFPYSLPDDSIGYEMSASVPNPIEFMTGADMSEAARLYNINCGICHGEKGQANGPLSTKVGAIANLTLDLYKQMKDGTMFHSITYGRNKYGNMGSYASQLNRKQRWMVIKYVRTLQGPATAATATDSTATAKDSTAVVKK